MLKVVDWLFVLGQFLLLGSILVAGYIESQGFTSRSGLALTVLSTFLLAGGAIVLIFAAVAMRQIITPFPAPLKNARLVRRGIYKAIRHPIYSCVVCMTIGYCLSLGAFYSLPLCVVLILFFELKTQREEKYLKERFPEYEEYSRNTKKFIPLIY